MKGALALGVVVFFASGLFAEVPKDITKKADIEEYERGAAAATNDLKNGVIKYEIIGITSTVDQELKDRTKKEYNIDIIFHGCIPGPQVFRDRGYQDTIVESLKKKYGFDPVQRIEEDLQAAESTKDRTNSLERTH